MKVAIIGAGVSGLACAYQLESYGVEPIIFEAQSIVGGGYNHVAAILQVFTRSIKDPLRYEKYRYDIPVQPTAVINKIIMNGPTKRSIIHGSNLGYFFIRGPEEGSLENNLFRLLKSNINFNTKVDDIEYLKREFDYVVVATGNNQFTKIYGCWQDLMETWLKGAVILGEFDPNTLIMWLNTIYAKSGYAYLAPYDSKRALLALMVPYIKRNELEAYWQTFLKLENISHEIVEEFVIQHKSGNVYPHSIENVYFVGNSGGILEPFLGFGQFHALLSGSIAARCIVESGDYEKDIEYIKEEFMKMLAFRKALDTLTNNGLDFLVNLLGFPVINKIVYNTGFNAAKYASWFVDNVYNRLWGEKTFK